MRRQKFPPYLAQETLKPFTGLRFSLKGERVTTGKERRKFTKSMKIDREFEERYGKAYEKAFEDMEREEGISKHSMTGEDATRQGSCSVSLAETALHSKPFLQCRLFEENT